MSLNLYREEENETCTMCGEPIVISVGVMITGWVHLFDRTDARMCRVDKRTVNIHER